VFKIDPSAKGGGQRHSPGLLFFYKASSPHRDFERKHVATWQGALLCWQWSLSFALRLTYVIMDATDATTIHECKGHSATIMALSTILTKNLLPVD
jgi:hypothetical protein